MQATPSGSRERNPKTKAAARCEFLRTAGRHKGAVSSGRPRHPAHGAAARVPHTPTKTRLAPAPLAGGFLFRRGRASQALSAIGTSTALWLPRLATQLTVGWSPVVLRKSP